MKVTLVSLSRIGEVMKRYWKFWLCLGIGLLIFLLLSQCTQAGINEAMEATCRISSNSGGPMGTGIAVQAEGEYLYILTNSHVVEGKNRVVCEFWRRGFLSSKLTGDVIFRKRDDNQGIDIAVIRARVGAFRPTVIPIGNTQLIANSPITSVGVAKGSWPTAWIGHIKDYTDEGNTMLFIPSPANGRSGSAIMDEGYNNVIGLLYARNEKGGYGYAMSLKGLQRILTQCGPNGCPLPGRNINILGRQVVPPLPQAPMVDVSGNGVDAQARAELAILRAEVARLGEIARRAEEAGILGKEKSNIAQGIALGAVNEVEEVGLLADDALKVARGAQWVAESVQEEVQGGGLFARLKDRVAGTAVSAVISKLGLPALGLGGGLLGVLFLLIRSDIKDLRENGDPLFISKLAARTSNEIDDKIAAKVTKVAETDLVSKLLERLSDRVSGGTDGDSVVDNLVSKVGKARELLGLLGGLKEESKPIVE